jgi:hypothetical protein
MTFVVGSFLLRETKNQEIWLEVEDPAVIQ